jgi:hypothetical protein
LGAPKSEKSLSDWIVSALRTQPRSLEDLKRLLANAPMLRDHEWPGRAINFALVRRGLLPYLASRENTTSVGPGLERRAVSGSIGNQAVP